MPRCLTPACKAGFIEMKNAGVLFVELLPLPRLNLERIDFVDEPLDLSYACPLIYIAPTPRI